MGFSGAGVEKRMVEVLGRGRGVVVTDHRMRWGVRPWNTLTGRVPETGVSGSKSLAEASSGQQGEKEPGSATGM